MRIARPEHRARERTNRSIPAVEPPGWQGAAVTVPWRSGVYSTQMSTGSAAATKPAGTRPPAPRRERLGRVRDPAARADLDADPDAHGQGRRVRRGGGARRGGLDDLGALSREARPRVSRRGR